MGGWRAADRYARSGQVLAIAIAEGRVTAKVQGSRPTPYDVTIQVKTLTPAEWSKVLDALGRQALFAAKLLAGEMPQDIEPLFEQVKLSLFPARRGDLTTRCSCPDDSNPCKHIAAAYYLLGEEFDRDPFLIFTLRGLSRDALMTRLGASGHRADGPEESPAGSPRPPEPLSAEPRRVLGRESAGRPGRGSHRRSGDPQQASGDAATPGRIPLLAGPVALPGDARRDLHQGLAAGPRRLPRPGGRRRAIGDRFGRKGSGVRRSLNAMSTAS